MNEKPRLTQLRTNSHDVHPSLIVNAIRMLLEGSPRLARHQKDVSRLVAGRRLDAVSRAKIRVTAGESVRSINATYELPPSVEALSARIDIFDKGEGSRES